MVYCQAWIASLFLLPVLGQKTLQQCQAEADAWCNTAASGNGRQACARIQPPHCASDRYVARLGRGSPAKMQLKLQWRCFAESVAANASNTKFATECYCTHHAELESMLTTCQERVAPGRLVFSSSNPPASPHGTPPYTTIRIPALLRASDTLLAFGAARRGDGGDDSWVDLLLRRSFDGGVTWAPVQLLHGEATPATIDNPCPIWDAVNQRAVLIFMHNMHTTWITMSSDHGATWSSPRNITNMTQLPASGNPNWVRVYSGPPGGIQTRSGRLICPSHHARTNNAGAGGTDTSFAMYSDDFGMTWHIGNDVTPPMFSGENQLVQLENGSLLTSIRENGQWEDKGWHVNRTRMFALSEDEGVTWGRAFAGTPNFPETNCEGSIIAWSAGGGQQFLFHSGILGGGIGALEPRTGMVIRVSDDGGRTWPHATVSWAGQADYSSLQMLEGGQLGVLYTRNATQETVFQRIPALSLTGGSTDEKSLLLQDTIV